MTGVSTTDVRVRAIVLNGVLDAYGSGPGFAPEPGNDYGATHCPRCGRPLGVGRVCDVHGTAIEVEDTAS